jgi:hypothetical protein
MAGGVTQQAMGSKWEACGEHVDVRIVMYFRQPLGKLKTMIVVNQRQASTRGALIFHILGNGVFPN